MKNINSFVSLLPGPFAIFRLLTCLCAVVFIAQGCSAQAPANTTSTQQPTGVVPVQLDKASIEGGKSAPATMEVVDVDYQGKTQQGLKLVMQHRVAYNSVNIPVAAVDGKQYNTLQFKVRFDTANGAPNSFGIWIINKASAWAATNFLKHAKKLDNGWYQFSWDMVNQPDNRMIDMSSLNEIRLRYGFANVPEGKTDTITVTDMKFVSGLNVRTGDPELYQQWKPIYSLTSQTTATVQSTYCRPQPDASPRHCH